MAGEEAGANKPKVNRT
jgi:Sec-independent protein translocase protein TatA